MDLHYEGLLKLEAWASKNCEAHIKVEQEYAEMKETENAEMKKTEKTEQGDTDMLLEDPEESQRL